MFFGSLEGWEHLSSVVSNMATAFAIGGGAIWAYFRYVRERTRWPRAEVELLFDERDLGEQVNLLNVKVRVKNAGRGLMELNRLRVDLRQVRPLDPRTLGEIKAGERYGANLVETDWLPIAHLERKWSDKKGELEPGEVDDFGFDFFPDTTTEVVLIYAFLENVAKKGGRRPLGWGIREFHALARQIGPGRERADDATSESKS